MDNVVSTRFAQMTALEEASLFHKHSQGGFFSMLVQHPDKTKRQTSYPLVDMPKIINSVDQNYDTWMSQAEFKSPNRRLVNLLRVGLLFSDLDTYNTGWAFAKSPDTQARMIMDYCANEGLPVPSLIVYSGRGLQAKWLLDGALPKQALPRWNACQQNLIQRLENVGSDTCAKDASRVLRLVNTVNTKSGEKCRVICIHERNQEPIRYNFEWLCETLLPIARWDLEKRRTQRLYEHTQRHTKGLRRFCGEQLAWDRLEDLRKLLFIRGGAFEGERMRYLFWMLNFLLLSRAADSCNMYYEAAALAKELDPCWGYRSQELRTLYAKSRQYDAGVQIEFEGKKYAPLYTPTNDTLINLFRIKDEEQEQLHSIISKDMARKRDKGRREAKARLLGRETAQTYHRQISENALERKRLAHQLRKEGVLVRVIAQRLNVSQRSVLNYLRENIEANTELKSSNQPYRKKQNSCFLNFSLT